MPNLSILLALSAAAAWAIGMTAAKPGIRHMDLVTYTLARWLLVSVLALIYALVTQRLAFPGWWPILLAAIAGVLDSTFGGIFYLLAMERTSAHQTTTLSSTAPLWGVFGAVIVLGEPFLWEVVIAAILVIVGAVFLTERQRDAKPKALLGAGFALITGILWGFAETVPAKLALQAGMSPETLLLVFALSGALGMFALLPILRPHIPRRVERRGIIFVVLSAVGGAFLGWLLWLHALILASASVISPVRGSTLLFAFIYSVLFLKERPTARAFIGIALVAVGVLLVSLS
ncbi:DMT family transporter [Candidatus Bipolaricaulota bacterium]|nr:DMT family transporter [Candidatus Bipolaricaulota bacterium]